ncbi:helix-turn-helix transcriptional regulator [Mucilaginibacter lappiensis]|uniref:DNA-binding CsgD family transcriptional regulator n=1 Tax=Mucilaginibacter lappiensis TaxID=354630 RepID=A0A841JIP2_9SPHI|nr:LuxR C-terminal-related transcriptional regulator [Mucilaginibacter lappiensis]MBB6130810.1 DNA-binding CsgD family transcriptional regulator [Mucilaginibacter lappiensis]
MLQLPYHSHVVSWLFVAFELLLIIYLYIRSYPNKFNLQNWLPLIVLSLLMMWNGGFGYTINLFDLVGVNTIALMVVVMLMALPLFFKNRAAWFGKQDYLPKDLKNTEPSDSFMENCLKYGLSSREVEVVVLSRKGWKNKKIAETLFISERTVEGHLRNIYLKVGCERSKLALMNKLNS